MSKQKEIGLFETYIWISITFILTLIYSGIYRSSLSVNGDSVFNYSLAYILLFSIFLFFTIMIMSGYDGICGKSDPILSFYSILYPFSFIFLIGISFLQIFPGWIRGFSNTIGSWVINLGGFQEFSYKLLSQKNNANQKQPILILEKIYNNPLILFNELTLDNYEQNEDTTSWKQLDNLKESGLIRQDITKEETDKLAGFIYIKNLVGMFIWYTLLSVITFFVSINNLLNSDKCMDNVSEDVSKFKNYLSTQLD